MPAMTIGRRPTRRAFTLIELMIVVAIIGILSVLAIYGVRKYIAHTKTAEARNSLGRMAQAAVAVYEQEHMSGTVLPQGQAATLSRALCGSSSKTVPSSINQVRGQKYQSAVSDWNVDAAGNSGFSCLHFTIDQPQYYMYNYTLTGSGGNPGDSFTGTANGDLNGDGIQSTFSLTGAITSGFTVNVAPNIAETNPEE
jgi:prepilin-type N-terminal cleavage/methylation domain-containing protein